jgi:hypothetical protein
MRFAGDLLNTETEEPLVAMQEYPADQWNKDDDVLLRSLERGEMGDSPDIRKAILDLRARRNLFRGV